MLLVKYTKEEPVGYSAGVVIDVALYAALISYSLVLASTRIV